MSYQEISNKGSKSAAIYMCVFVYSSNSLQHHDFWKPQNKLL